MTGAEPVSDRSLCTVWRGALDSSHSKMKHFLRARLDLARHRFGKMLVDGEPINSQCAMSAGVLEAGVGTLPATGHCCRRSRSCTPVVRGRYWGMEVSVMPHLIRGEALVIVALVMRGAQHNSVIA